MVGLGEPVIDPVCLSAHVEAHLTRPGGVGLRGNLTAIVGQDRRDTAKHSGWHMRRKLPDGPPVGRVHGLANGEPAGTVTGPEERQLSRWSALWVEEADGGA